MCESLAKKMRLSWFLLRRDNEIKSGLLTVQDRITAASVHCTKHKHTTNLKVKWYKLFLEQRPTTCKFCKGLAYNKCRDAQAGGRGTGPVHTPKGRSPLRAYRGNHVPVFASSEQPLATFGRRRGGGRGSFRSNKLEKMNFVP